LQHVGLAIGVVRSRIEVAASASNPVGVILFRRPTPLPFCVPLAATLSKVAPAGSVFLTAHLLGPFSSWPASRQRAK
jgi:hypothetical protein